jgi:hypothetical protein
MDVGFCFFRAITLRFHVQNETSWVELDTFNSTFEYVLHGFDVLILKIILKNKKNYKYIFWYKKLFKKHL